MKQLRIAIIALTTIFATSCSSNDASDQGKSTPIDSTNVNGTAPATYGGNNPANDQNADSNRSNVNDTGTKADNVHNTGH